MSSESTDLVEIFRGNETEAQVIRSRLEYYGIPSVLKGEAARRIYGINVDGIGEVRVLVLPSLAERARDLIDRSEDV